MLFDEYSVNQVNEAVNQIKLMVENGILKKKISKNFPEEHFEELFSIAKARIKDKKGLGDLFYTLEDLRWATNKEVAKYRSKRLKCNTIVEIGAGVGIQTLEFAKTCKKVIAIEIDERKLSYAIANAELLGVDNVEFILGDALKKNVEGDIIFVDFEREAAVERRHVDALQPNPKKILEKFSRVCFEFPPQIRKIPFNCEKEYVSVDGDVNRLNLYFNDLKKAEYSAVILPSEKRLEGDKNDLEEVKKAKKYLYEIDSAIVKAGLIGKIGKGFLFQKKFLTSDEELESDFFKNKFEVLHQLKHNVKKEIELLNQEGAGDVILRMKMDPKLYWKERLRYKSELKGDKKLHLFVFNKIAMLAKKFD